LAKAYILYKNLKIKACFIKHLLALLALANSNKFKNESKI